jgi:hypothetical protein
LLQPVSVGLAVQAGNFVPGCKTDFPHGSVAGSGDSVSLGSKVSGYGIKDGEETLCLLRRFEPFHPPLALPGRLMGILSPVVQIAALPMNDMGEHGPFGGAVASEFVGNNDPGLATRTAKEFPKETLRRDPVAFRLNENVDHGPVLIDSTPKIMLDALDLQEDLIEVPLRPQLSLVSAAKFLCVIRAELIAPLPDRFVGQLNTAPRHHLLDVSVTHREPEVEPDHLADDIAGKAMTTVEVGWGSHPISIPSTAPQPTHTSQVDSAPADTQDHDLLVKVSTFEQLLYRYESWHLSIIADPGPVCTRPPA